MQDKGVGKLVLALSSRLGESTPECRLPSDATPKASEHHLNAMCSDLPSDSLYDQTVQWALAHWDRRTTVSSGHWPIYNIDSWCLLTSLVFYFLSATQKWACMISKRKKKPVCASGRLRNHFAQEQREDPVCGWLWAQWSTVATRKYVWEGTLSAPPRIPAIVQ